MIWNSRAALLLLVISHGPLLAQNAPGHPAQPGTVTGHVTCADTQRPARLAKVALVTAEEPPASGDKDADRRNEDIGRAPATEFVETGLDGSYTLSNVAPGSYYIIVDTPGYALPLAQFNPKDFASKDAALRQQIAKALQKVNVRSNATVIEDIALERGASVSGTVSYDDGSPASSLSVDVLQKDATGKWKRGAATRYRAGFGHVSTDEDGRYHIAGLAPGEYLVEVDLTLSEYTTRTSHAPGHPDQTSVMRMQQDKYSLPLFSGNALREAAATPIALAAAEQRTGANFEFPLSKLHSVSGQVIAKDGHVLNSATVNLLNSDDSSQMTSAKIDSADDQFHLAFVPEGSFLLKVSDAKDITKFQVANPAGEMPRTHEEEKTLRTYGGVTQALKVQNETQGIILTVPDPGATNDRTAPASE
jgi:hypothetical protein